MVCRSQSSTWLLLSSLLLSTMPDLTLEHSQQPRHAVLQEELRAQCIEMLPHLSGDDKAEVLAYLHPPQQG